MAAGDFAYSDAAASIASNWNKACPFAQSGDDRLMRDQISTSRPHEKSHRRYLARRRRRILVGEVGRFLFSASMLRQMQEYVRIAPVRRELVDEFGRPRGIKDVYLEVRSRCNSTCSFCLASVHTDTRPDRSMSIELYRRIVSELKEAGADGILSYHCMNEPLLHPQLAEFIRIATRELPRMSTRIITNGRKLTPATAKQLVEAGTSRIHITAYMKDVREQLDAHFQRLLAEMPGYSGPTDPWSAQWTWGGTYFQLARQELTEVRDNLGGLSPNAPELTGKYWGFCEFPFRSVFIDAEGKLGKCTWDFGFTDPVGHMANGKIEDEWRNGGLVPLREQLLRGDRSGLNHCNSCNFAGTCRRNTKRTVLQKVGSYLVPEH